MRCFRLLPALTLAACAGAAAAAQGRVIDDRGVAVHIPASPPRIIALAPHLAEIAFAAGAGERLIAGVRYTDFPPAARRLPHVGDAVRLDLERVRALAPDLLLGWKSGNPPHTLRRLERAGFTLFVTEARRLQDVPRLLRAVGALAGTSAVAEQAADEMEAQLRRLAEQYAGRPRMRVFYQIWHRPLLTVNAQHIISDVIALCGGDNVFGEAALLTPSISDDALAAARPDIVLGGSSAMDAESFAGQWRAAKLATLRALPVRYVPADLIQRPTPRIVEGARIVCRHLEDVRRSRGQAAAPR